VLSITSPQGSRLAGLTAVPIPTGKLPSGDVAPSGSLSFEITGLSVGESVIVKLALPAGSDPTSVLKLVNGQYLDASSIATISGDSITLLLTDGGLGDEDQIANGTIVDPLVPVQQLAPTGFRVSSTIQEVRPGVPFSQQLTAADAPGSIKWTKVGSLPKGVKLSKSGLVSGTLSKKTIAGLYPIDVQAKATIGKTHQSVDATLTLPVS
jgi:hypothetical protein